VKLPSVYVNAAGLACPIGLTWPSACAAMRAGITRKRLSPYRDDQGREIVASYVLDRLSEDSLIEERWLFFLAHALRDATRGRGLHVLEDLPIFLTLPSTRSGGTYEPGWVSSALSQRLGVKLFAANVHVLSGGASGGFVALQTGRASAQAGRPCAVAAADSLLSAARLLPLAQHERLLVEGNSDGFIPGEAAAILMLSQEKRGALARLCGVGFGLEPSLFSNEVPLRAEGLIAAAREALSDAGLRLTDLDFRLSDAAGESFFFKEQSLLVTRLLQERKQEFPLWLPAETLGNTGAAAGLCSLLWAMAAWERGYAPGPRALACAGNEQGNRAAVVFEKIDKGERTYG